MSSATLDGIAGAFPVGQSVGVGRMRTDVLGESVEGLPRWIRRSVLFVSGYQRWVLRPYAILVAVAGVVGIVVGIATRDATTLFGGAGSVLLAGVLLALNGGSETVSSVSGPEGAFVVRTSYRPTWRAERGSGRVGAFVKRARSWSVVVRTSAADPFGAPVLLGVRPTEREALARARAVEQHIREGSESLDRLAASELARRPASRRPYAGVKLGRRLDALAAINPGARRIVVAATCFVALCALFTTASALLQEAWGVAAIFGSASLLALAAVGVTLRANRRQATVADAEARRSRGT